MSLFGCKERQRITELESENVLLKRQYDSLKRQYDSLVKLVKEITELSEHIPEDCAKGPWCGSCAFSKVFPIVARNEIIWSTNDIEYVYVCVKNGVCKDFVEKAKES